MTLLDQYRSTCKAVLLMYYMYRNEQTTRFAQFSILYFCRNLGRRIP